MADPTAPGGEALQGGRPLSRRDALRATGAASLGLLVQGAANPASTRAANAAPGMAGSTPLEGRITQSVARWCFEEIPLVPFCRGVADMGLTAMDLLTVEEWPVAHDHGLIVSCGDVAAGTIEDGLNEPRNHAGIIEAFERHIPHAARVSVPNVICFFGNRRGMEGGVGIENSIRCLRECAPIAESEEVTILVEVLNSKPGGHVDYIGDRMDYALEIIRAVDSPRVKILYDIYHMQIMEGDIIRTLTEASPWIGHYHTGGVPGRAEIDDSQELNYPPIVRAIADTGFEGYMAHEFIPRSGDPLKSLREAVELCDV
ncbi:hydroxypyruvate isomerase family protein [Candidatus Palauibacter sp.]|uniref:hydroxypyruvate isomerase family protein n=1 Tax=Candidatus Palauibacter sp. TaxID=3101350 RepID=UPI003B5CF1BB